MEIGKDTIPIEIIGIKITVGLLVEIDIVRTDTIEIGIDPLADPQGDIIGIIETMIGMGTIEEIGVILGKGMITKIIRKMAQEINTTPI